MTFEPHPRLAADTHFVADWPLCRVLRMNDVAYPWLVLVPRRKDVREIIDLEESDQQILLQEIGRTSDALRTHCKPDKLNVAALGNVVPQLHIHVIARFTGDPAWPRPIWGVQPPVPFANGAAQSEIHTWRTRFGA